MIRSSYLDIFRKFIPSPKVPETIGVLKKEPQKIENYENDGIDDESLEAVVSAEKEPDDAPDDFVYVDLTKEKRTKKRGYAQGKRLWKNITGITLHQTAVDFGLNPIRLLNVPAHGGTLRDGKIVLLHTPTDYMWHAHSLNKHDIGIEISCRAAGILGNRDTFWRGESDIKRGKQYEQLVKEANDIQIAATLELCKYYIELVKKNGGEIKFIHAHRQGHKSRTSDPGSRIWKEVAIPLMKEYNLSCGPVGWKAGSGTPIPQAWDEVNGKGIPYTSKIKGF